MMMCAYWIALGTSYFVSQQDVLWIKFITLGIAFVSVIIGGIQENKLNNRITELERKIND